MAKKYSTTTIDDAVARSAEEQRLEELLQEPFDELDRELAILVEKVEAGESLDEDEEPFQGRFSYLDVERNRPMAVFTYCSILFAIPVFLVPLFSRRSEFALHHAKAAGVTWLLGTGLLLSTVFNCALFLPLVFICYIPALIGMYRASAGVEAGSAGLGDLGEKWFRKLKVTK